MTDFAKRRARVREVRGIDAVVLVPGANLRYFTGLGFGLSERPILAFLDADGVAQVLPELEAPQLAAHPELSPTSLPGATRRAIRARSGPRS